MTEHKRVVIVGGVAGGASCAARMRRMDEKAEILVLEKGPHVSFANCGLPYYTGGVIEEEEKLLLANPEKFRATFGIDVRVMHEVTAIDRDAKTVEVLDRHSGQTTTERYDALVLSPGATPIVPPFDGVDLPGIFTLRTVPDAVSIRAWVEKRSAKRAVVVGGGFIGLEMAENLRHRGLEVTLIEMLPQVMPPLDPEMITPVHEHLREKGVDLRLETAVKAFEKAGDGLAVLTEDGGRFEAEIVIMSIGVRPSSQLAKDAGLELNQRGAIKVDKRMRTSDPAIYAIGDAVETYNSITDEPMVLPLAGPANRQGRLVADLIAGRDGEFRGVQGTAVVGVFDLTVANTGLSEKACQGANRAYEKVYVFPANHVGYYPGAEKIALKLVFDSNDGRVLGAQAVGKAGVARRIDVIAMAIQMGATVFDLEQAELCYAPQYGAAKDPVNMAGFVAANAIRGDAPVVHWPQVMEVLEKGESEQGPVVLDARPKAAWERGNVPGVKNIPLPELRERLGEIPKDRPVWVHCMVGQTSHNATRVMRENGFDASNISGGFTSYQMFEGVRKREKV